MYLLAVESSTPTASVALVDDAGVVRCRRLMDRNAHTEQLMEAIDQLLQEERLAVQDLAGFAVAVGPGAFVALRVGIATVKGLALGTGKPVVPVFTLAAMAVRARLAQGATTESAPSALRVICPMIDARREQVYAARYRMADDWRGVMRVGDERLATPEEFLEMVDGSTLFLGDGAQRYRRLIEERLGGAASFAADPHGRMTDDLLGPDASAVAMLGLEGFRNGGVCDPAELSPVYYRPAAEPAAAPGGAA